MALAFSYCSFLAHSIFVQILKSGGGIWNLEYGIWSFVTCDHDKRRIWMDEDDGVFFHVLEKRVENIITQTLEPPFHFYIICSMITQIYEFS